MPSSCSSDASGDSGFEQTAHLLSQRRNIEAHRLPRHLEIHIEIAKGDDVPHADDLFPGHVGRGVADLLGKAGCRLADQEDRSPALKVARSISPTNLVAARMSSTRNRQSRDMPRLAEHSLS